MPLEVHEHFDAEGNLTGRTEVAREPEWNDRARQDALALIGWDAARCPTCGNYDTLIPFTQETRNIRWPEHDNRKIEVTPMRCLACGAMDLQKRDFAKKHEKDKPVTGQSLASDGHMFVARPLPKED